MIREEDQKWELVNFKVRHGTWNKCIEKKVMTDGIKVDASSTILSQSSVRTGGNVEEVDTAKNMNS